jgi:hypothetical protein
LIFIVNDTGAAALAAGACWAPAEKMVNMLADKTANFKVFVAFMFKLASCVKNYR